MEVHETAIGVYPNVAIDPRTGRHAATDEPVEIPEWARVGYEAPEEERTGHNVVFRVWGADYGNEYLVEFFGQMRKMWEGGAE